MTKDSVTTTEADKKLVLDLIKQAEQFAGSGPWTYNQTDVHDAKLAFHRLMGSDPYADRI
jgi:hypothetical protein